MRCGRKKSRWTGQLAKPIRVRVDRQRGLAITDPETVTRANEEMTRLAVEAIARRVHEKLHLLMEYYSIPDKDDWFSLAVALARDHVPGFQWEWPLIELSVDWEGHSSSSFSGPVTINQKKVGRHKEWDSDRLERLLVAVEQEKAQHGVRTDREAISRLATRREWARAAAHRGDLQGWIETLEARLQDAKTFRRLVERAENKLKAIFKKSHSRKFRKFKAGLIPEFSAVTLEPIRFSWIGQKVTPNDSRCN